MIGLLFASCLIMHLLTCCASHRFAAVHCRWYSAVLACNIVCVTSAYPACIIAGYRQRWRVICCKIIYWMPSFFCLSQGIGSLGPAACLAYLAAHSGEMGEQPTLEVTQVRGIEVHELTSHLFAAIRSETDMYYGSPCRRTERVSRHNICVSVGHAVG